MELEKILIEIKNHCDKNNIILFEGTKEDDSINSFVYTLKNKKNDWVEYFNIVSKLDVKIVFLENYHNEINLLLTKLNSLKERRSSEINIDFEYFNEVTKYDNQVYKSSFSFTYNQNCYQLIFESDWIKEYELVKQEFEEAIEQLIFDENPLSEEKNKETLTNEKLLENISEFIEDNYSIYNNRDKNERKKILVNYFNKKFQNNLNHYSLIELYNLFEKKYNDNLRNSVLELKKQKLSKVEIGSILQIGEKLVNKFYFSESIIN